MKRILVVDKLESFLATQDRPPDTEALLFSERDGVPAGEYLGLVPVVTTPVRAAELERAPSLRVIANYGVGYDNIDVAAARRRGIAVSNTPGVLTDATAELTWALIFAVARRLGEGERLVRTGKWTGWTPTQLLGLELKGRSLGIVGAGRIGRAVAERAAAFGMHVRYWNRVPRPEWEAASGAHYLPLPELLSSCDVVSIHLARAADTERLIDASALATMRDGAILINTSRGAVIDEHALIAELESGRLSAGLDVYIHEPAVPAALCRLDNVVVLPHLGSATRQARQAMWDLAWANLLRGIAGEPLINAI